MILYASSSLTWLHIHITCILLNIHWKIILVFLSLQSFKALLKSNFVLVGPSIITLINSSTRSPERRHLNFVVIRFWDLNDLSQSAVESGDEKVSVVLFVNNKSFRCFGSVGPIPIFAFECISGKRLDTKLVTCTCFASK